MLPGRSMWSWTGVACAFSTIQSGSWTHRADSRYPSGPSVADPTRVPPSGPRGSTSSSTWEALDEMDADPRHELGLDRTISDLAAYGTWAFRFGDPASERSGPAYLEEIVADEPVCSVSLERLPDSRAGGLTLATAAFPTDVGSVTRNRVQPLYGSTHLVIQKLREVHDVGWDRCSSCGCLASGTWSASAPSPANAPSSLRAGWAPGSCGRHFGSR